MDSDDDDQLNKSPTRISFKKWFLLSTLILLAAISVPLLFTSYPSEIKESSEMASEADWKDAKTIYEFKVNDLEGKEVSMDKYKGNVVIMVNVATYCGLTKKNYAQLNELFAKYKDQGLRIAGFPCNQFNNQEPGCSVDIQEFLKKNNVEFDVYEKIDVNGKNAHPLWKWLQHKKGGFITDGIKWNFTKFLIGKNGEPVKRYGPTDEPKTFEKDIQAELAK